MNKKMSGTIRALKIIQGNDVYNARRFAELMWPTSPCWQKVYNIGHGATRGVGMWLAAGSFLRKLQYKGLISIRYREFRQDINLTEVGRQMVVDLSVG